MKSNLLVEVGAERLPYLIGTVVADLLYRASLARDRGDELEVVRPLIRHTVAEAIGAPGWKGDTELDPDAAFQWLAGPPQGSPFASLSDLAEAIGLSPQWARRIAVGAVQAAREVRHG